MNLRHYLGRKRYFVSKTQLDGAGNPKIVGKESGSLSSLIHFGNLFGKKLLDIERTLIVASLVIGLPITGFLVGRKYERDTYEPSLLEVKKGIATPNVFIDGIHQLQLLYDPNLSDPNRAVFTNNPSFMSKLYDICYDPNQDSK